MQIPPIPSSRQRVLFYKLQAVSLFDRLHTEYDLDDDLAEDDYNNNDKVVRAMYKIEALRYAIRLDELPAKYRQLKVLGRGATSIVLEYSAQSVLVITRDRIKYEWLVNKNLGGLELGKYVEEYKAYKIRDRSITDIEILVIEMPRLYPLNAKNKAIVKRELEQFNEITYKIKSRHQFSKDKRSLVFNADLWNYYQEKFPNSILLQALEFGASYEQSQFSWDFHLKNFLQEANSTIVVVDPVISTDVFGYISGGNSR